MELQYPTPENQVHNHQTNSFDSMGQQYRAPQKPTRRRKPKLAPWERFLWKFWPPVRLFLLAAIALCIIVLLITLSVSLFI